jgi:hypothetical protein
LVLVAMVPFQEPTALTLSLILSLLLVEDEVELLQVVAFLVVLAVEVTHRRQQVEHQHKQAHLVQLDMVHQVVLVALHLTLKAQAVVVQMAVVVVHHPLMVEMVEQVAHTLVKCMQQVAVAV